MDERTQVTETATEGDDLQPSAAPATDAPTNDAGLVDRAWVAAAQRVPSLALLAVGFFAAAAESVPNTIGGGGHRG